MLRLPFIFVTTLHLLAVNVAAAGPLAAVLVDWLAWRRGDEAAKKLTASWMRLSMGSLVVGMTLGAIGVGVMWLEGDDWFFESLQRFPAARYGFAAAEIVFYFACVGIAVAWIGRASRSRRTVARIAAVAASTNLLYHFPPLFVAFSALATSPDMFLETITPAEYRRLLVDPEVASRSVHHGLAAVAIACSAAMAIVLWQSKRKPESDDLRLAVVPARIAVVATILQLPVGIWTLLAYRSKNLFLGDDMIATSLLATSIFAALGLMHYQAAVALGDCSRKTIARSIQMIALVVLLMTAALDRARDQSLEHGPASFSSLSSTVVRLESDAADLRYSSLTHETP